MEQTSKAAATDLVAKQAMELARTNVDAAMTFVQNAMPKKFLKHHREFVEIKSFCHLICIIIIIIIEFLVIYLHSIISMHENNKNKKK